MTQNEIIEMAKQAGIKRRTDVFYSEFCDGVYADDLEAFAALVRADEREACAKVCEDYDDEYDVHTKQTAEGIALQIRARRTHD
jgi:hypothetical protein